MHASATRVIFSLLFFSFFIFPANVPLVEASDPSTEKTLNKKHPRNWNTQFTVKGGYRVDDFDWNIGADYTSTWDGGPVETRYVNILSELTWEDLEIYQVVLSNRTVVKDHFYFRGAVGYGNIFDGKNQDSDYKGNDRTQEFSRSNNAADSGSVIDASAGIGYLFQFKSGKVGVAPVVGYDFHQQNLKITDGYQTLSVAPDQTLPVGPIQGLDSSYDTEWHGPFLGVDLLLDTKEPVWWFRSIALDLKLEYHWADYYAEADWNLIANFQHPKSFEHEANGTGFVIAADWIFGLSSHWDLALSVNYMKWSAEDGTDRLFLSDGTITESHLNEVNWESMALMLGFTYRF